MNMQENLRALAASDAASAPFGFEAFEQRRAMVAVRRRATMVSAAGSIAALAFVSIMAFVMQQPPELPAVNTLPPQAIPGFQVRPAGEELPALVNLDQFDVTTELQDHIAVLDAELSAARVEAASAERLRQLESTRAQLNQSLQRVSYAHSLLSL
jgi:hypothetical protein